MQRYGGHLSMVMYSYGVPCVAVEGMYSCGGLCIAVNYSYGGLCIAILDHV